MYKNAIVHFKKPYFFIILLFSAFVFTTIYFYANYYQSYSDIPNSYTECVASEDGYSNPAKCTYYKEGITCGQYGGCNPSAYDDPVDSEGNFISYKACELEFFNPDFVYPETYNECVLLFEQKFPKDKSYNYSIDAWSDENGNYCLVNLRSICAIDKDTANSTIIDRCPDSYMTVSEGGPNCSRIFEN